MGIPFRQQPFMIAERTAALVALGRPLVLVNMPQHFPDLRRYAGRQVRDTPTGVPMLWSDLDPVGLTSVALRRAAGPSRNGLRLRIPAADDKSCPRGDGQEPPSAGRIRRTGVVIRAKPPRRNLSPARRRCASETAHGMVG